MLTAGGMDVPQAALGSQDLEGADGGWFEPGCDVGALTHAQGAPRRPAPIQSMTLFVNTRHVDDV